MKTLKQQFPLLCTLVLVCAISVACDSSSDPGPSVDVTGTWVGLCTVEGDAPFNSTWTYVQTDANVGGTVSGGLSIAGTVSENVVTATAFVQFNATNSQLLTYTASVAGDTMSVSGSFTEDMNGTITIRNFTCSLARVP